MKSDSIRNKTVLKIRLMFYYKNSGTISIMKHVNLFSILSSLISYIITSKCQYNVMINKIG